MKETTEEVAVINYKKLYEGEPLTQDIPIDAFKQGAKWQQERSYSEKDMEIAFGTMSTIWICFEEFIEQFKKK